MRPVFDPTGGPDVLVEKMIGRAYDTVKRVAGSLPELQRLDGVLGEIEDLAQTTVDGALSTALPGILAAVDDATNVAVDARIPEIMASVDDKAEVVGQNTAIAQNAAAVSTTEADRSSIAATSSLTEANRSSFEADRSTEAVGLASVEADRAAIASQAALTAAGIKTTIAEGITSGLPLFWVPSPDVLNSMTLYENVSGAAVPKTTMPSSAFVAASRLTSGDVLPDVSTFGQALNGGVLVKDASGRIVGLTIPAGQTGNTTYVRAELGLQPHIAEMMGTKITIDVFMDASLNFLAETAMTGTVMQVLRAGIIETVNPDSQSITQSGNIIHKTLIYTIKPGDSDVYPVFRPGISTTAADRTATMKAVSWAVGSPPTGYTTWSDYHLKLLLEPMKAGIAANTLTSGELMQGNLYRQSGEVFGGATRILDSAGGIIGLSVPSGVSGGNAYLSPFFQVDGLGNAGSTITVTAVFDATIGFLQDCPPSGTSLQVLRGGGAINVAPLNVRLSQEGTKITKIFDYVITPTDLAIAPTYQIVSTAPVLSKVRTVSIASIKYSLSNTPPGETPADIMLAIQLAAAINRLGVRGQEQKVKVAATGGDFTTLPLANTANASANVTKPVTAVMKADETVLNLSLNDFFSVSGGKAERVTLDYRAPVTIDPPLMAGIQVLRPEKNNHLTNIRVSLENGRYPIHSDSGNSFKNGTLLITNCDFEHLGNQSAQDYQNTLPGGGGTVWPSWHAWGYGSSSGQKVNMQNGRLKSPRSAYYMHTNVKFDDPSENHIEGMVLVATQDTGKAVYVQPLGSGQADMITLRGNSITGDIYYWCNPWLPGTLEYQPANHSEVKLFGYGNSPAVFEILEFGRALKIQSATDGPASAVSVSGSAALTLFGERDSSFTLQGCPGIPGYTFGYSDISGVNVGSPTAGNITSLGKRLGNCVTVNKRLVVLVDGAITRTVTFNRDYTNISNTDILASINSALLGSAVASAYNVGARYRPMFTHEELELMNNSSEGILMGMALAFDGHHKKVRKMTSTDPSSLFAGIAWEDIYPGKFGRVKTSGYLSKVDLLGGLGVMTFRQPLYVNPLQAGALTLTVGANPIMRAIRPDAVEVIQG